VRSIPTPGGARLSWACVARCLAVALAAVTLFCLLNMPAVGLLLVAAVVLAVWWAYGA
jgi:hypothetical protein